MHTEKNLLLCQAYHNLKNSYLLKTFEKFLPVFDEASLLFDGLCFVESFSPEIDLFSWLLFEISFFVLHSKLSERLWQVVTASGWFLFLHAPSPAVSLVPFHTHVMVLRLTPILSVQPWSHYRQWNFIF